MLIVEHTLNWITYLGQNVRAIAYSPSKVTSNHVRRNTVGVFLKTNKRA